MRPGGETLPKTLIFRRAGKKGLTYLTGISIIVWLRGMMLASLVHGHYRFCSFFVNTLQLLGLMVAWHVLYFLFRRLLSTGLPSLNKTYVNLCCAAFVAFAAFPSQSCNCCRTQVFRY